MVLFLFRDLASWMLENFGKSYISGSGILVAVAVYNQSSFLGFVSVPCYEGSSCKCKEIKKVIRNRMTRWNASNGIRPAVLTTSPIAKKAIHTLQEGNSLLRKQAHEKDAIIEELQEEVEALRQLVIPEVFFSLFSPFLFLYFLLFFY